MENEEIREPVAAYSQPELESHEYPIGDDVFYPESDGEPMGETGFHVQATMDLFQALKHFFDEGDKDYYVAADMFLYYEEGNPKACKAPDIMVIRGVEKNTRRTFKTWEENATPCVIIEVTSKSTIGEDLVIKSNVYRDLGVLEYYLFDPLKEYLDQRLMGFRLTENEYEPIPPDSGGRLSSHALNLIFCPQEELLRIIDADTGIMIPSFDEAISVAARESERAARESERAERESERAERESERAERLAAKLREMGIDSD